MDFYVQRSKENDLILNYLLKRLDIAFRYA